MEHRSATLPDEAGLDEDMLAEDPLDQFAAWMADAVAVPLPEPTAMVLATVSASGRPRARTVLLKELRFRRIHVLYEPHLP